jgi:hypothetical protein
VVVGGYKVLIPASWSVGVAAGASKAVEVKTASTAKLESGLLFARHEVPQVAGTKTGTATVEGVEVTTYDNGRVKTFAADKFALVVTPVQKSTVTTDDRLFAALIKSVESTTESPSERFVHAKDHYQFDTLQGSKIVASLIGKGAVIYAPEGVPATQEEMEAQGEQGPTVTIRVGDPSTEADCLSSLDEWESNFRNEEGSGGGVTNVSRTKVNGRDCVTVINKDMQEIGPGQRQEIMAKIFVFVKEGRTTLIRWEVSSGQFKKYERKMMAFMDSFQIL